MAVGWHPEKVFLHPLLTVFLVERCEGIVNRSS
jgi:hypothetical protein